MDSIYLSQLGSTMSEVKRLLPHFPDEHTEALRGKTLAQGPGRSPQLSLYIFLTGCWFALGSLKVRLAGVCLGGQVYLEGSGNREAHEAGAKVGLAQHSTHGGCQHQHAPQELQVGSQPPARRGR